MLSMTGFGKALLQRQGCEIDVEVRSVNNRFLKIVQRLPRALLAHESELEALVREQVDRGSVTLTVRLATTSDSGPLRLDEQALRGLHERARELATDLGLQAPSRLETYLTVPGVVSLAEAAETLGEETLAGVRAAVREALEALRAMRRDEGARLETELRRIAERVSALRERIAERAPTVVEDYRERLAKRMRNWLDDAGVTIDDSDLLREVALFADRSDVAEELQRLGSHLEELGRLLGGDGIGRKLDFLVQEMLRETNTVGSKASDAEITRAVVEVKSELERLREQAQNVE